MKCARRIWYASNFLHRLNSISMSLSHSRFTRFLTLIHFFSYLTVSGIFLSYWRGDVQKERQRHSCSLIMQWKPNFFFQIEIETKVKDLQLQPNALLKRWDVKRRIIDAINLIEREKNCRQKWKKMSMESCRVDDNDDDRNEWAKKLSSAGKMHCYVKWM